MAESETSICNMALNRIGAKRINDLDKDDSPRAIACRLHYEQTRDSLIRSHRWRFASARASLSQDTEDPDFEYDNQFILPTDILLNKSVWGDNSTATGNTRFSFDIEGERLLTNDDSVDLKYTKKVTDTSKFDPLFIDILVLLLAKKLIGSLAGIDQKLMKDVKEDIRLLMPSVRALDRNETNTIGRLNRRPWVEARLQSRAGFLRPAEGVSESF